MRNLIIIAILLGGGAYALATPGPQPVTETRTGAATVAEARLIASLRELAAPVVVLTEDAYALRPLQAEEMPAPRPSTPAAVKTTEVMIVKPDALNLRAAPSTQADVLARLLAGQEVQVEGRENGWVQVANAEGVVGWAHGDFLTAAN